MDLVTTLIHLTFSENRFLFFKKKCEIFSGVGGRGDSMRGATVKGPPNPDYGPVGSPGCSGFEALPIFFKT